MSTIAASITDIPTPPARNEVPRPIFTPLAALLENIEVDAEARHKAKAASMPFGPRTGLKTLDLLLGGALTSGLHILHGSPGIGKTAFALQMSACCGCPALFVTCEMSALELLRRHTARETGTVLGKLKDGSKSAAEVVGLAHKAAAAAPRLAILDATQAPAPPHEIVSAAGIVRVSGDAEHFLIVVDSLHSWADALGGGEEYERLNVGLSALRLLAKHLDCPVLAIAERNRASMKSGGQSSGAGTRKIEYGAETVLAIDADDDARPDAEGNIYVTLRIGKNRNGASGKPVLLRWHGATQRYTEVGS